MELGGEKTLQSTKYACSSMARSSQMHVMCVLGYVHMYKYSFSERCMQTRVVGMSIVIIFKK